MPRFGGAARFSILFIVVRFIFYFKKILDAGIIAIR